MRKTTTGRKRAREEAALLENDPDCECEYPHMIECRLYERYRDPSSHDRFAPRPRAGTEWVWAPGSLWAEERVRVTRVSWNGEEWWVQTYCYSTRSLAWNDLEHFWDMCVYIPE